MLLVWRGKEPDSLLQYRKGYPDSCYEDIPSDVRFDIRKQLWEEQKGLCAYCTCKIKDFRDVRIEHYEPRHPDGIAYDAGQTLNYKTMLGVCYGNSLRPGVPKTQTTCDAHRGNTPLTVNPYDIKSVRKIRYSCDGRIYSDDVQINKDVDKTLNLNCEAVSLPECRKQVLIKEKEGIRKLCKGKSHEAYLSVLKKRYERYVRQEAVSAYCGIVISWLEKELKIV